QNNSWGREVVFLRVAASSNPAVERTLRDKTAHCSLTETRAKADQTETAPRAASSTLARFSG
ncbi:hypothetical protein, partial [Candidatus Propionivibrio aalborgensis]|uniref:hypothetical protein n=1 Tax=Candidatus Propionivibrio aalborgensis TaxID=1860101 RepID=UPI001C909F8A